MLPHRVFLTAAAGLLLSCTSGTSGTSGTAGTAGAPWQGELRTYAVNSGQQSILEHRLQLADGTIRPLIFSTPPSLPPGTQLRVWGSAEGEAIRVERHQVDKEVLFGAASALVAGTPKKTRRWAFVLLDIDGAGNPINKDNAQSVLFSPDRPDSIRSYFREVSYGVQDMEGQVFGPLPYQMGGRCDTDRLAKALIAQVPGEFDHYLWFFGTQQAACNWAGIADLGRADRPTKHSWFNSFHSCTVLVQEPGHNFGMVHSSAMRCTLAGKPVPIAWPNQEGSMCKHQEYGNPYDPMGGGDCYHMNGVQKAYQDWLAGCNVVKPTSSGTFTIYPLESACDGPQLLQIPLPQPRAFGNAGLLTSYYLELRAPVGYRDRKLVPQVLVIAANDVREARFTGNNNWLLDMTPETDTLGDEGLPVGRPFQDALPGGPKFTVLSADATKAVIQVELQGMPGEPGPGKAVCADATAFDPTKPIKCVAPAGAPAPPASGGDAAAPPASDAGTNPDPPAPVPASDASAPGKNQPPSDARTAPRPPGNPQAPVDAAPPPASSGGCQLAAGMVESGAGTAVLLLAMLALATRRRRAGEALIRRP